MEITERSTFRLTASNTQAIKGGSNEAGCHPVWVSASCPHLGAETSPAVNAREGVLLRAEVGINQNEREPSHGVTDDHQETSKQSGVLSLHMLTKGSLRMASVFALTVGFAGMVEATQTIAVTNPGFEDPVLADGVSQSAIPGWTEGYYALINPGEWVSDAFGAGVYNVSTDSYSSGLAASGENMAFVTSSLGFDGGIRQILSANLLAETTYTLTVKIGNPFVDNGGATAAYRVELLAGNVLLGSVSGPSPANDSNFTTATLIHSSGLNPAQLGQPLQIRLIGSEFTDGFRVDFDDVQLTASSANPIVNPGGPYTVSSTGSLALDGSNSFPSDGATITAYEWDLDNDGDYDEAVTGATPTAIPFTTLVSTYGMFVGSNTIRLKVTDSASKTATATVTATLGGSVNLTASDTAGTTSFTVGTRWSNTQVPTAGNAYFTQGFTLRTPQVLGNASFGGGALTLGTGTSGSQLMFKTQGVVTVNRLILNGGTVINAGVGANGSGNESASLAGNIIVNANSVIDGGNPGGRAIDVVAPMSGPAGITINGANGGSVIYSASAKNYSGNTTITSTALLRMGLSNGLPNGAGKGNVVANGQLNLNGFDTTINGLSGNATGLVTSSTPATLDVGSANATTTFNGSVSGAVSLKKSGTGVLTVGGAASYSGHTTVDAGTLALQSANANSFASNLTLAETGALLKLDHSGTTRVYKFFIGSVEQPAGVYGHSTSGAANSLDTHFAPGSGTLTVGDPIAYPGGPYLVATDSALVLNGSDSLPTPGSTLSVYEWDLNNDGSFAEGVSGATPAPIPHADLVSTYGMIPGTRTIQLRVTDLSGRTSVRTATVVVGTTISLTATDPGPLSSFTDGTRWSDGLVPVAANTYRTSNFNIRTPQITGNATFPGRSLSVDAGGTFWFKTLGVVTVNNLILNGGTVVNVGVGANGSGNSSTALAGAISVNANSTLDGGNPAGRAIEVQSSMSGSANLVIAGATGSNITYSTIAKAYSGNTTVNANAQLRMGIANAMPFGTGRGNLLVNGTFNLNGFNTTLNGISGNGTVTSATAATLTAGEADTTSSLAGSITGAVNLVKTGSGTLTLGSASNSYTGTTTIEGGTLLVNGTHSGTGAVSVNQTGTLGGSGSLGASVTLGATANLAPGNGAGVLTIGGGLDLSAMAGGTGLLVYEIDAPVGTNDRTAVTGTLTIGSGVLGFSDFAFSNLGGLAAGTYKLITSGGISGTLDADDLSGTIGDFNATLQLSGDNRDVELLVTAVGSGGYSEWALINAPTGGPEDDFDGDGVGNAIEFVLGGDKDTDDSAKLPSAAIQAEDLVLSFVRNQDSIDPSTSVAIEIGTDLASWPLSLMVGANTAGSSSGVAVTKDSPTTGLDTVTVTVAKGTDLSKFARMKVSITP